MLREHSWWHLGDQIKYWRSSQVWLCARQLPNPLCYLSTSRLQILSWLTRDVIRWLGFHRALIWFTFENFTLSVVRCGTVWGVNIKIRKPIKRERDCAKMKCRWRKMSGNSKSHHELKRCFQLQATNLSPCYAWVFNIVEKV